MKRFINLLDLRLMKIDECDWVLVIMGFRIRFLP